jgi:hypothetical protein
MSAMIRNATAADADAIATLAREFQAYLRALGDRTYFEFTAETYRRDGFGPNPAFSSLVAERDSQVIGYLLSHFGYDTDRAMRLMHVIDLSVCPGIPAPTGGGPGAHAQGGRDVPRGGRP